jgi:hypothetical protein
MQYIVLAPLSTLNKETHKMHNIPIIAPILNFPTTTTSDRLHSFFYSISASNGNSAKLVKALRGITAND